MSLRNIFILSYFGMMVNKETIGVCVFPIHLMIFTDGWAISTPYIKTDITQTCNKNTERHQSASMNRTFIYVLVTFYHQNFISFKSKWQSPKIHDPTS